MSKKNIPALVQMMDMPGANLNLLPLDYKIYEKPVTDEKKWGTSAYVSDDIRNKILKTGAGELQVHINYIKGRIEKIRKLIKKSPHLQAEFDL